MGILRYARLYKFLITDLKKKKDPMHSSKGNPERLTLQWAGTYRKQ